MGGKEAHTSFPFFCVEKIMNCVTCGTDTTPKWYHKKTTPKCCKCYSREYRKNNPDKVAKTLANYASSEKGRIREKRYAKSDKGRTASRKASANYKSIPENYEKLIDYGRSDRRKTLAKASYRRLKDVDPTHGVLQRAKRRATQKSARPHWADLDKIKEIYTKSAELSSNGDKYEVDHIIPLTHDKVSGLDIPENLQILTRSENRTKSNQFDGTNNNSSWREV